MSNDVGFELQDSKSTLPPGFFVYNVRRRLGWSLLVDNEIVRPRGLVKESRDIVISPSTSSSTSTIEYTTSMSTYPGQELSLEQLFYALNAKIFEQTRIFQSSIPGPDQQRWVST